MNRTFYEILNSKIAIDVFGNC